MKTLPLLLTAACAAPSTTLDATLAEDTPPVLLGRARYIYADTVCETQRGYLPYIRWDCDVYGPPGHATDWPRVNVWAMLTVGRASVPSVSEETPFVGGWVISHFLAAQPLTLTLAPGCQLLPKLDTVLIANPRNTEALPEGLRVGAWREGSTAFLLLNPLPATLGQSFYVQFVEWAPGQNMLGLITGPTVQLAVGNTTRGR